MKKVSKGVCFDQRYYVLNDINHAKSDGGRWHYSRVSFSEEMIQLFLSSFTRFSCFDNIAIWTATNDQLFTGPVQNIAQNTKELSTLAFAVQTNNLKCFH